MRRFIAPAAAAVAVLALAGCSADAKDFQEQGENFLEGDEVRERMGMVRMSDAACQEPASTDKDTTYTCTATGSDGNIWGFTIEISGSKSLRVITGEVITPGATVDSSVPVEPTVPATAAASTSPLSTEVAGTETPTTVTASPVATTPGTTPG